MRKPLAPVLAATLVLTAAASRGHAAPPAAPATGDVQIVASEMCCKGCAQKISGRLYVVKGVRSVAVDLPNRQVTVSHPSPDAAVLGSLWDAVQQGDGGPTKLVTRAATYQLAPPKDSREAEQLRKLGAAQRVVVEDLHCQGCAQKIASRLYAIKGVTKVGVDLKHDTLLVETGRGARLSPWLVADAVARADERPLAVSGAYGTLTIEWASAAAPKNHQALHPNNGVTQR